VAVKLSDSRVVLGALVVGLAGGAAIAASGSPGLVHAADLVAPIGTLWVEAIRMTVIPLVLSLLITAVASASDLHAMGRVGGRTLATFFCLVAGLAVVMIPLYLATFSMLPAAGTRPPLPPGATEAAGQLSTSGPPPGLGAWLTSLVPVNPVAAAAQAQMLPLIVFTLLLALAIARVAPAAREPLLGFFRGLRDAMLVLVRWVVDVAPIGVFGLVLPLGAHLGIGLAGSVGLYVGLYMAGCVVAVLLLYGVVRLAGGVPVGRFGRALLPAQLIAFSSSSSIASLPALVEGADERLRLPDSAGGFVIPLAVSTFHVAAPVSWTVGALFIGRFYGVPLHAGAVATVAFAAVFLGFAVPGVPQGAFIMLAPLFTAIGLPIAGLGILIAVDAIPDLFATVLNVTGDLAAAAIAARGTNGAAS
jgi:Na+/H+-dicarboxylate symporter